MKLLFVLAFGLLFFFDTLHAQEIFLACDSLAIPGNYLHQTPDGGFLVETYSTAEHIFQDPGFALIKLDATGRPEWGRLYPAKLLGRYGSFCPEAFLPDKEGNLFAAGSAATDPFNHVPAITLFTPQGVPIWSHLLMGGDVNGTIGDLEQLPNNDIIISGSIYPAEEKIVPITTNEPVVKAKAFVGNILARLTPEGERVWMKVIKSVNGERIPSISLFHHGSDLNALGHVVIEGCCVDNPLLLIKLGNDGSVLASEVISIQSKNEAQTYVYLTPEEIITTTSGTIVYGQLLERTALPNNDPNSMPRHFENSISAFVMKLDRDNDIIWGRRIKREEKFAGLFRATVTTGEEIILASTSAEQPVTIIRLDSAGTLLSAQTFAEGIDKRFDYPDDAPPHPPLDYFTVTAIAPTFDGGIAGLCDIDVEATGSEELEEQGYFPYYGAGFFRLGPNLVPQCIHPERASITVEPLEFVREKFLIKTVEIDTSISSTVSLSFNDQAPIISPGSRQPLTLNPIDYRPEVRELCENGLKGHSVDRERDERAGINITLSPNTIFAGKETQVEYNTDGDNASTSLITLLNASSGRVYATISGKNVDCNGASGRCSATIDTKGLPSGIYLVCVTVGNREERAKLRVQE